MGIGSYYIDPIYIVLLVIGAVFIVLIGLLVIMRSLSKELKRIAVYGSLTSQNTAPMRKLTNSNFLLLEVAPAPSPVIPNDITQRIPVAQIREYASRWQQLCADGSNQPITEPYRAVGTKPPVPYVKPSTTGIYTSDNPYRG